MRKDSDSILRKNVLHIALFALITLLLNSCRVGRFVPEGKYFLDKNVVEIDGDKVEFTKSEVSSYITQQPHKVRFPMKFSTWLYYATEENKGSGLKYWINENLSKKPEYFEPAETSISSRQMEQYLNNRGYFNSRVTASTEYKGYRAKVVYTIHPATPYRISNIEYQIEDTVLKKHLSRLESRLPAQPNQIYNAYTLDEQRTTVTNYLRNLGYYFFSRGYITYEVDSSFNNHTLEIAMKIANVEDRNTGQECPHKLYTINKVSVYPDYRPSLVNQPPIDSTTLTFSTGFKFSSGFRSIPNTLHIYYHDKPQVRPGTFSQLVMIMEKRPYRQRQVELTYSALSSLKMYANTNIEFEPLDCDTANLLNCKIMMRRGNIHSLKVQTEATNSGGDLGISGSVTYTNKNIFKGAEVLTVSLKGGLEAQEIINLGEISDEGRIFNTGELIFNSSIYFPKFLSPIPLKTFARDYQPRTNLNLGGSVQKRYAYSRYINMASFGYDWKANNRLQFVLTPIYVNYVKVNPIPEFQALLDLETNQRIKDQYTSHFVVGGRYSVIYNTQSINTTSNYIYIRGNLESSGGLASLLNNTSLVNFQDDHYDLFGIRYAQYLRGDVDFRQYYKIGNESWLVLRQLVGLGIPYGNSYDMPFERSFYSGGSIGMRGWRYRNLGPGSYLPGSNDNDIERIGDIQLECNAELRFPIHGSFNGALFVDAGNIWNYHANPLLPGGEFHFNTFYNQIAVDAGVGARLDFGLVIVRLDWAMPVRTPYPDPYQDGKYWSANLIRLLQSHFSFNIGYPF